MRPLFTSYACDWCDGLSQPVAVARGWVLWRPGDEAQARELYVFPSREMADYYRRETGAEGTPRQILCETPIRWTRGRGRVKNLELADKLYTVYPDCRFEPGPYRAYVAP
jgi:hypothetical protein